MAKTNNRIETLTRAPMHTRTRTLKDDSNIIATPGGQQIASNACCSAHRFLADGTVVPFGRRGVGAARFRGRDVAVGGAIVRGSR